MKPRSIFIALVAGLAAGVSVGSFQREVPSAESLLPSSLPPAGADKEEATDSAALRLAFPSDDGRIGRVFSALQQPILVLQRYELREALRDVTAAELPGMMKHAETLPKTASANLMLALVERWCELDPKAARAWVLSGRRDWTIIRAWGRADPEGAYPIASETKEPWANTLLIAALDGMHGTDVAAKIARAQELPQGTLRSSVFSTLLYQLVDSDPVAALSAVDQLTAGPLRNNTREGLMRRWAEKDPAAALEALDRLLPTLPAGILGNQLVTRIAQQVAEKDPQLVLNWLREIPAEFGSIPAVATARTWAEKEPLAALEWCFENGIDPALPEWQSSDRWRPAVLGEAMKRAPEETFARLASMATGAERDRLLECAFMESLWHTPKQEFFAEDGATAFRFFEQLPPEGQIAKAFLFGQRRAEQGNLEDLRSWAQNFPSGQARINAIAGAMNGAWQHDRVSAESLLANVDPGPDRDAALKGYTVALGNSVPSEAASRALQIADPVMKQDVLDAIIPMWLSKDADAGHKWLDSNPSIPAEWKQQWLRVN